MCEWHPHLATLGGRAVRGHDGVREYLASLAEEWDDFRQEPEQLLDAGDEVVVFLNTYGRGRASGVEIELQVAHVLALRGREVRQERDVPGPRRGAQRSRAALATSSSWRGSSPSGQTKTRSHPASA